MCIVKRVTCLHSMESHVDKGDSGRWKTSLPQGALGIFSTDHQPMAHVSGKCTEPNPPLLSQLLPHIPPMVASLVKEDSNSGTSCLEQLAELVHCMVFRFPGFPDLYEPVMEAIKVSDSLPLLPCPTPKKVLVWALLNAIIP